MQSQPQNTVNSQCSHETKRYICLVLDCLLLRVQSTAFANLCLNELCYFDVASIQTFLFQQIFHTQGFTAILSQLVKSVSLWTLFSVERCASNNEEEVLVEELRTDGTTKTQGTRISLCGSFRDSLIQKRVNVFLPKRG